jgi:DNA polymerase-3 subunit gamma/tau
MEDFIVSARKYRPATFDTVVGQKNITGTLKNAIKTNHLAQAFLFCGPRGVGKTTCARILAKTINCFNLSEDTEACDQCESCIAFKENRSMNIFELDAASKNSVDDIRSIIDQVRIPPQIGTKSIYIIDEVHMLSTAAFNAFLKTLEEPPKHAIFILATTEKHKILTTILSRCQIFDFQKIKTNDIAEHLAAIARNENINAEFDALQIIAQKADGGLRDALSIFDQLVTFSGSELTYTNTITNLNILDFETYFKLVENMFSGQIGDLLWNINQILKSGFDGHQLIIGLAEHFRNVLLCKDTRTLEILEVIDKAQKMYVEQAQKLNQNYLIKALEILSTADTQYKSAKNQRLFLEFTLLQICGINDENSSNGESKKK